MRYEKLYLYERGRYVEYYIPPTGNWTAKTQYECNAVHGRDEITALHNTKTVLIIYLLVRGACITILYYYANSSLD